MWTGNRSPPILLFHGHILPFPAVRRGRGIPYPPEPPLLDTGQPIVESVFEMIRLRHLHVVTRGISGSSPIVPYDVGTRRDGLSSATPVPGIDQAHIPAVRRRSVPERRAVNPFRTLRDQVKSSIDPPVITSTFLKPGTSSCRLVGLRSITALDRLRPSRRARNMCS